MSIYPGAIFTPTGFGGRTPRRKGQRGILHVAVSERPDLPPWNVNTWHFYVNKAGQVHQYVDTEFCAWASVDANGDAISIESQGGVNNPQGEPWTDAQAHAIAGVIRWVHDIEGTPIELLPDSRPGRRGWGPHRLGIDPWRVSGGQVWSGSRGKVCPGDAKIGQIPGILAMAAGGAPPAPPAPPTGVGFSGSLMAPWPNLPAGHCLGDIKGPANVHGGDPRYDSDAVRWAIEGVQRNWIAAGLVPGVPASQWRTSGWADGKWDAAYSSPVCRAWFARFRPSQPIHDQVWSDDYAFMRGQTF